MPGVYGLKSSKRFSSIKFSSDLISIIRWVFPAKRSSASFRVGISGATELISFKEEVSMLKGEEKILFKDESWWSTIWWSKVERISNSTPQTPQATAASNAAMGILYSHSTVGYNSWPFYRRSFDGLG